MKHMTVAANDLQCVQLSLFKTTFFVFLNVKTGLLRGAALTKDAQEASFWNGLWIRQNVLLNSRLNESYYTTSLYLRM